MDVWLNAILEVLSITNLLVIFLGCVFGIIMGAIPGLSSNMSVAVVIPFTFTMEPSTGLILLAAIYCSSVYGGSISAILLNTPGTPAGAATVLDGYELTKQGLSGKALGLSVIASAVGGIISAIILSFGAPILAEQALRFGAPEYFALAVFGLTIISSLSGTNILKGLMAALFGVLIATVGMDPMNGNLRYTFSNESLLTGFELIPVLIGLFSISQAFILIRDKDKGAGGFEAKPVGGKLLPSFKEIKGLMPNMFRSSILGTGIGIIPGVGSDPAAFIAYNEAKRWSKKPEKFGKGSLEGLVAPESSNNAVTGGALIPLLTLGIPGNSVTAILLGGLLIQGLAPGPQLFQNHSDVVYALFFSLFLSNITFLILGLLGVKYFNKIINIQPFILAPIIIVTSVVGSYAIFNNYFDIWVMFIFGVIGYLLRLIDVPLAPIVLAIILGPLAESGYRQSMLMSGNDLSIFVTRPISAIFLIIAIITFIIPFIASLREGKRNNTA